MNATSRFRVVPAGRRSGKTENAKRFVVEMAMSDHRDVYPRAKYFCAAPTRDQAKRIYWEDLKDLCPRSAIAKISESELTIWLVHGPRLCVIGMDKPMRADGEPLDGGILDEFGDMKATAFTRHIRPALSTDGREGWCWFIGKPTGRNHYYDRWIDAIADTTGQWTGHTWKSSTVLSAEEVQAAKRDLDPLSFRQEYEAEFLTFSGRAYYSFDPELHAIATLEYNAAAPIALCFDFNVNPGVCAVIQEHGDCTDIIGEVWIPNDSNTQRVCRKIVADWGKHAGDVYLYGDATGAARKTSAVLGSDWDLIVAELQPVFKERLKKRVGRSNPPERVRVNAVNARLLNAAGEVRLRCCAVNAKRNAVDFEGVTMLDGTAGELDKKSAPMLTHMSDAVGYYVARKHPIKSHRTRVTR